MSVRIGLPRLRYSYETNYTNRPGYHNVQYELIMMSNQNVLLNSTVREAVMHFVSDSYHTEAFAADYLHRLSDAVIGVVPASASVSCSDVSWEAENSLSGMMYFLSF